MEKNLKGQVKPVVINGKIETLQEKNVEIGMKMNSSSEYLESIQFILRSEWDNLNSKKRNAIITGNSLINQKTCKIIFKLLYHVLLDFFHNF